MLCRSRLWRRIWSTFTAMSETFWAMAWIRSMRPGPAGSLRGRSQGEPAGWPSRGQGEGGPAFSQRTAGPPTPKRQPALNGNAATDSQARKCSRLSQPGLMELANEPPTCPPDTPLGEPTPAGAKPRAALGLTWAEEFPSRAWTGGVWGPPGDGGPFPGLSWPP